MISTSLVWGQKKKAKQTPVANPLHHQFLFGRCAWQTLPVSLSRRAPVAKLWAAPSAGRRGAPPAASACPGGQTLGGQLHGGEGRLSLPLRAPTAKLWAALPTWRRGASRCLGAPRMPNFEQRPLQRRGGAPARQNFGQRLQGGRGALLAASARPGRQTLAPCREEGGRLPLLRHAPMVRLGSAPYREDRCASCCFGTPRRPSFGQRPLKGGVCVSLPRRAPGAKLWAAPPTGRRGPRRAPAARLGVALPTRCLCSSSCWCIHVAGASESEWYV